MERVTPYILCKRLETQLQSKISSLDLPALPHAEQAVVQMIGQNIIDARLTIQDYELAETRQEQLHDGQESKNYLDQVMKGVLSASQFGIFGAVDVAHLSATIEQITDKLQ